MLRFVALTIWCNFTSLFNSKTWLIFPPVLFFLMRFLLWLKVHIGFYSSYNNTVLRPAITNAVRKARKLHGHSNIIVTGHSMGGAIASFCALDLAVSDPQILNIYLFAQGSFFTAQEVTIGGHGMFFFLHDLWNVSLIYRWALEVTMFIWWLLGNHVLAMLLLPPTLPSMWQTQSEWHMNVILYLICRLISSSSHNWRTSTSPERYAPEQT